jgi:hypothetical protein
MGPAANCSLEGAGGASFLPTGSAGPCQPRPPRATSGLA